MNMFAQIGIHRKWGVMNTELLEDVNPLPAWTSDALLLLWVALAMVCFLELFLLLFPPPKKGIVSPENRRPKYLLTRYSREIRRHCHSH